MIKSLFDSRTAGNIIKYPIITDKATRLLENNKYSFIVDPKSAQKNRRNNPERLELNKYCPLCNKTVIQKEIK